MYWGHYALDCSHDCAPKSGRGEYQAYTGAMLRCEKFFPAWSLPITDPVVTKALHGLR